jgi:hypothetical protein
VVIGIKASVELRIIYRCFHPKEEIIAKDKFIVQLNKIRM